MSDKAERSSFNTTACNAAAGAGAGVIAATFVCPLEAIKTRLQVLGVHQAPMFNRQRGTVIFRSLQDLVKKGGFIGLYRATTVAHLCSNVVYFTVYENLKAGIQSPDDNLGIIEKIVAVGIAGTSSAIVANPLWVVHTRFMNQGKKPNVIPYKTVFSALSRVSREEGLRGLYRGILPSLLGVSHAVIYFPVYEWIMQYMEEKGNTSIEKKAAVASSISKVIASVMTYPHEVIRSKLQDQGQIRNIETQYLGFLDCTKKVFRKEGFNGFYHGCATNLLKSVPQAIVTFTTYEVIHGYLKKLNK